LRAIQKEIDIETAISAGNFDQAQLCGFAGNAFDLAGFYSELGDALFHAERRGALNQRQSAILGSIGHKVRIGALALRAAARSQNAPQPEYQSRRDQCIDNQICRHVLIFLMLLCVFTLLHYRLRP
jgi:hypothetical protein